MARRRRRRKADSADAGGLLGLLAAIGLFAFIAHNPGILILLVGAGLFGMGLWWWASGGQRRRFRALRLADVDSMAGHQFEEYVAMLLEHQGYSTTVTKKSGDLGVDVIAAKGPLRYAVQTKRYSGAVPRTAVSDAVAGMAHYQCNAAMVVTTHRFTDGAQQLARSNGCLLVDRDELARWILAFQEGSPGGAITHPRAGWLSPNNIPPSVMAAGAGLVLWAMVRVLGHQGDTSPPQSASAQRQEVQQSGSTVAQYRDAIRSMNPTLTADAAERVASSIVRSSTLNVVDARLLMAVLAAESNFALGADPEAKVAQKTARLGKALKRAGAERGTELQRLQAAIAGYQAESSDASGRSRDRKVANRRRREFTRKVVRLYYQMSGKMPPG